MKKPYYCKTCVHWVPSWRRYYGGCKSEMIGDFEHGVTKILLAHPNDDEPCFRWDFGCVYWAKRSA